MYIHVHGYTHSLCLVLGMSWYASVGVVMLGKLDSLENLVSPDCCMAVISRASCSTLHVYLRLVPWIHAACRHSDTFHEHESKAWMAGRLHCNVSVLLGPFGLSKASGSMCRSLCAAMESVPVPWYSACRPLSLLDIGWQPPHAIQFVPVTSIGHAPPHTHTWKAAALMQWLWHRA